MTGTPELFLATYSQQKEAFNALMKLTDNGYATDDPRFGYESKEAYLEVQPAFSPNGNQIAYVSNASGNLDIYITSSEGPYLGANNYNYTDSTESEFYPSWHPNGEYLAFNTIRNGKYEIHIVNLSNNQKEPLIQMTGRHAYEPAFSPDGTLVAFTSRLVSRDGFKDIYIHDVATGENTNITNTALAPLVTKTTIEQIGSPHWSPDGSKLVFHGDPDATDTYHPNQLEIFTMNKDGSNLIQITTMSGIFPKWSSDGTSIYFVAGLSDEETPKIHVMDTDGSNVKRVTNSSNSSIVMNFDIYK
jgi:TolB protein